MNGIYDVSITFRDLNGRMCGLKQGAHERMADVSMKLEQYHGDHFGTEELSLMKKDCFYAGLKEANKYLISHMKDQAQYGPAQMLNEIREQEDSHILLTQHRKPLRMTTSTRTSVTTIERMSYPRRPGYTPSGR